MTALRCGGRPHYGQSGPDFTLARLVRQLGSKHNFLRPYVCQLTNQGEIRANKSCGAAANEGCRDRARQ
jgi:hypothetical protein